MSSLLHLSSATLAVVKIRVSACLSLPLDSEIINATFTHSTMKDLITERYFLYYKVRVAKDEKTGSILFYS